VSYVLGVLFAKTATLLVNEIVGRLAEAFLTFGSGQMLSTAR